VATAYPSEAATTCSDGAGAGKRDDAAYYAQCSRHIQAAYETYLVAEDGTIQPGHQAAYVRALALDMVTGAKRQRCDRPDERGN
jgi:alpha-L-rhamnosidase